MKKATHADDVDSERDTRGNSSGWVNVCTKNIDNTREMCLVKYWYNTWKGARYDISPEGEITTTLHVCRTLSQEGTA